MTRKLTALHKAAAVLLLGAATLQPGFAAASSDGASPASYTPDVTYTLRTDIAGGKLVFIGEIFDRVYGQASLTSPPLTDVQTTTVAPGGATMVEFQVDYPGKYILVDHALSRMEKGLVGFLHVAGTAEEAIFEAHGEVAPNH